MTHICVIYIKNKTKYKLSHTNKNKQQGISEMIFKGPFQRRTFYVSIEEGLEEQGFLRLEKEGSGEISQVALQYLKRRSTEKKMDRDHLSGSAVTEQRLTVLEENRSG